MQDDSRNRRRLAADSVARRCALMRERAELKRNNARRVPMTGTNLGDIRTALEERGFELHGAHPTRTHHAGRFNPTWREVWVSNRGDDEQSEAIRNHSGS